MGVPTISIPTENLLKLGLKSTESIHYQLSPRELIQDTLRTGEGRLSDTGALVIRTGESTGRAPKDRFIVKDDISANNIDWNEFNIPIDQGYFDIIYKKILFYLGELPELWIRDCYACADPRYRLNVRMVNEKPWTNLFAYNMFLRPDEDDLDDFKPQWHVITAPGLKLDPKECGIRHHNAVVISFRHKMILIAGTGYTGE